MNTPASIFDDTSEAPPMDLRAVMSAIQRRWKLIVASSLTSLIVIAAALEIIPSEYRAGVQILIFDPQWQMGVPAGQQEVSGGQFDTVAINTEIEVIKSAALAMRVVRELKLDQDPEFHS